MQPLVSIIIPAYNESSYIHKCLDSIKNQSYKNLEIIVVCNGCTDNTEKIARLYNYKTIVLKEKNNPLAKNTGAQHSNGKFLIFLDADTRFTNPSTINIISNNLQKNNIIGTCKFIPNKESFKFSLFKIYKNIASHFGMSNGILFCRKDLFNKVEGFKNIFPGENHSLIKPARQHAKFLVLNKEVITSMRRFEKLGLFSMMLYWFRFSFNKKLDYPSIR